MRIYPSLATSNLLKVEKTLSGLRDVVDGFHVDMMDGHFVPNYGLSTDLINGISAYTPIPLWIHLMVTDPELALRYLLLRPEDIVTVHVESQELEALKRLFTNIRQAGSRTGIALNPMTAAQAIYPFVGYIDHITIMTVQPGFSGQQFLPSVIQKIEEIVAWAHAQDPRIVVGVDGGVNLSTLPELAQWGVDDIAVGSYIFFGDKPYEKIEQIRDLLS